MLWQPGDGGCGRGGGGSGGTEKRERHTLVLGRVAEIKLDKAETEALEYLPSKLMSVSCGLHIRSLIGGKPCLSLFLER